jgi:hypothetical protein
VRPCLKKKIERKEGNEKGKTPQGKTMSAFGK